MPQPTTRIRPNGQTSGFVLIRYLRTFHQTLVHTPTHICTRTPLFFFLICVYYFILILMFIFSLNVLITPFLFLGLFFSLIADVFNSFLPLFYQLFPRFFFNNVCLTYHTFIRHFIGTTQVLAVAFWGQNRKAATRHKTNVSFHVLSSTQA